VPGGNFYALFPHNLLVGLFAPVFLFGAGAGHGCRALLAHVTPATSGAPLSAPAAAEARTQCCARSTSTAAHGEGCNNEDDASRCRAGASTTLTFYGFLRASRPTRRRSITTSSAGAALRPAQPAQAAGRGGGVSLLVGTTASGA
jgi:citrate/tricarballylate utilization protein